jgi:hypothetical protein
MMDQHLAALVRHNPASVPTAKDVKPGENTGEFAIKRDP